MRKIPLFAEAPKIETKKRGQSKKIRRKTRDEQKSVETDRRKLDALLASKQQERLSRHFCRSPTLKKGCFKFALIKRQRQYFRSLRSRGSNPRYRRQIYKKFICSKVVLQKEIKTPGQSKSKIRSKRRCRSTPVEPKTYSTDKVRVRIETRVQQAIDGLRGEKSVRLLRFCDVEKQFGEVIERIKRLKFAVEHN